MWITSRTIRPRRTRLRKEGNCCIRVIKRIISLIRVWILSTIRVRGISIIITSIREIVQELNREGSNSLRTNRDREIIIHTYSKQLRWINNLSMATTTIIINKNNKMITWCKTINNKYRLKIMISNNSNRGDNNNMMHRNNNNKISKMAQVMHKTSNETSTTITIINHSNSHSITCLKLTKNLYPIKAAWADETPTVEEITRTIIFMIHLN